MKQFILAQRVLFSPGLRLDDDDDDDDYIIKPISGSGMT